MAPRLSTEEIKLRGTLLGSNKELLQLHRTLVRGGLITEEEFWETRRGLLDSQETLLRQKKPPSATLVDDMRATGDYPGDQKIILTPETIHSILSQNPAAKRAHDENVPSKMTEKEFWTYYVQSRFFRQSSAETSTHNPLDKYHEEMVAEGVVGDANVTGGTAVSRLVDITATAEDHFSDHTISRLRTSRDGDKSLSLIKKFNNHSLRIIKSCTGTSASAIPLGIEDATELEDLSAPRPLNAVPLELQPTNYKISSAAPDPHSEPSARAEEILWELRSMQIDVLSSIKSRMKSHSAIKNILSPLMPRDVPSFPCPLEGSADRQVPQDLHTYHSNSTEVLRHFWSCFPPGRDAEKQAKLSRMTTIVEQLLIKGKSLISSRRVASEQLAAENALLNVMTAMEHALIRRQSLAEHGEKRARLE